MGFHEIWNLRIFRTSVEKIQVSLNSDKNNRQFTWRAVYICGNISLISSQNKKYFSEQVATHLCSATFTRNSRHFWDNEEEYGRCRRATADNITWRMRVARWISKATHTRAHTHTHTHTLKICNTHCFSTATMVAPTHPYVTLYVHWLSCVT